MFGSPLDTSQQRVQQRTPTSTPLPRAIDETFSSSTSQVASSDSGTNLTGQQKRRLRVFNGIMCLFHSSLATVTLIVGNTNLRLTTFDLSLKLNMNASVKSFLVPDPAVNEYGYIYVTWAVSIFFMLSAIFHLGNAVVWYPWYISELEALRSPFRWIEYFFSASTMVLILAYLSGTIVYVQLFLIVSLISATMLFGHLTEVINTKKEGADEWKLPLIPRLSPHFMGYVPQNSAWIAIMYTYYGGFTGFDSDFNRPDFVDIIVWVQMGLFFSFGFVQLVVLLRKPSKYIQGEFAYQTLSLVAKGSLGGMLLANLLFFGSYECSIEELKSVYNCTD